MFQYKRLRLTFLVLLLLLPGCERQGVKTDEATEVKVELTVEPSPPAMGEALLELYLEDDEGNPIEGADLEIKGDMTHAGMEPVFGQFEEFAGGYYHANFEWTMGGDWIVTITGILPDGRELVRTFDFTVKGGM
jgi:hypothetical protein